MNYFEICRWDLGISQVTNSLAHVWEKSVVFTIPLSGIQKGVRTVTYTQRKKL